MALDLLLRSLPEDPGQNIIAGVGVDDAPIQPLASPRHQIEEKPCRSLFSRFREPRRTATAVNHTSPLNPVMYVHPPTSIRFVWIRPNSPR